MRWASRAASMRFTTIGTLSATTPSRGTSTSRASLPRMRNLPKSTGSLPPCRVDLVAEGRRRVEVAVAVVVGPARAHVHAASVVRTGGRLLGGAAPAGQRNDDRGQSQQHRGAGQDQ